jgi:hypothetical protein
MSDYLAQIPHRVNNIPCLIGVITFDHQPGSFSDRADSDWDYYGVTESTWELLDTNGRRATWLDRHRNEIEDGKIDDAVEKRMLDLSGQN